MLLVFGLAHTLPTAPASGEGLGASFWVMLQTNLPVTPPPPLSPPPILLLCADFRDLIFIFYLFFAADP